VSNLPEQTAVLIEVVPDTEGELVLSVEFAGFVEGERVDLSFIEQDAVRDGSHQRERVLGSSTGRLKEIGSSGRLSFVPDDPPSPSAMQGPWCWFRFQSPESISDYVFALDNGRFDKDEGDASEILVRVTSHLVESPPVSIARIRRQVEVKGATYDWHAGHDVTFYNDGSTDASGSAGAFRDMIDAIKAAKHFVFIVDWSFQPLFCPSRMLPTSSDNSIGALLLRLTKANPELLVAIHAWNHSVAGAPDTSSDDADITFQRLAHQVGLEDRPKNLLWRSTSRTGQGWSHHQKFIVLDAEGTAGRRELQVFWGGLDLTKGRFDWPGHAIAPDDPQVAAFRNPFHTADQKVTADDWYNAEFADARDLPRQPWHDIHGSLKGPAAWDFVREFVGRWNVAPSWGGNAGDLKDTYIQRVWRLFRKLYADRDTFVQQHEGMRTGKWSAQVYRSLTLEHWAPPPMPPKDALDKRLAALLRTREAQGSEHSIQLAYRQNIDRAKRYIYIENQYFIGSGKHWDRSEVTNDIPERLVYRILRRAAANEQFHVYILNPMFPEGDPVSDSLRGVRQNEWETMQYMVTALSKSLGNRWSDYLSFYFLANWSRVDRARFSKAIKRPDLVRDHMRYMIYVHAKLMVVDDRYALFGSCNINDRGLGGDRDSEIACGIWPSHGEDASAISIRDFRLRLWQEHFGELFAGADAPHSSACVDAIRARADDNYRNFRTMAAPPRGHICRLPLRVNSSNRLELESGTQRVPDDWGCLPDSPSRDAKWTWPCEGATMIRLTDLAD